MSTPMLILNRVLKKCNELYIFNKLTSEVTRRLSLFARRTYCSAVKYDNTNAGPIYLNRQAEQYLNRVAILDQNGTFRYKELLQLSTLLSREIMGIKDRNKSLEKERVAFLCENDVSYVVSQWATWMSGGVAVPLCKTHPQSELEYVIENSQCSVIVTSAQFADKITPISKKLNIPTKVLSANEYTKRYVANLPVDNTTELLKEQHERMAKGIYTDDPCMIIYTSGTTGRPKGVVLTYGNIYANITGMIDAWDWRSSDVILHVLPLHHVHGVVNALMVPLYCGATCKMMTSFDPEKVWYELLDDQSPFRVTVFMAVPTIYSKLIQWYEEHGNKGGMTKDAIRNSCKNIRLMVSGSAALPQLVMEKWEDLTGHALLERYGMTELGMVLTNPLKGPRIPGSVGQPFPGVNVCIRKQSEDSNTKSQVDKSTSEEEDDHGELLVKGPNVFKEYWNNPEATKDSFTDDGWFKTGDTATCVNGAYKIMGRTSVDIIKSGGYKMSALDIERHLLEHPEISECIVVGVPDITWGQRVAAVVVTKTSDELDLESLRTWCEDRLPPYQRPSILKLVTEIPRNAMGKVNKKDILRNYF